MPKFDICQADPNDFAAARFSAGACRFRAGSFDYPAEENREFSRRARAPQFAGRALSALETVE